MGQTEPGIALSARKGRSGASRRGGLYRAVMPWGLYSVFLYVEVGDSAPTERRKGRVRLSLWDFIREDFFRRELFLDENHLYFVFILLHASL